MRKRKGREREANSNDYVSILEEYARKQNYLGNHPAKAPADIGQALQRSEREIGKSEALKLKEFKVKGK